MSSSRSVNDVDLRAGVHHADRVLGRVRLKNRESRITHKICDGIAIRPFRQRGIQVPIACTAQAAGDRETAGALPDKGIVEMLDSFSRDSVSNHILARLSASDFALLEPHLQATDLPVRKTLEVRDKKITSIYFMESGFASVVANGLHKPSIEVGIIGREGMTGVSVILGGDRPANETFIQAAGSGLCISAEELRRAIDQSVSLHRSLLRFANSFLAQTTQTALANGRSKIEERLSRWLLMADDRIDGDELPLTHEFLSIMLGVQRSGVTIALQALEREGLISTRRSKITIIDRKALEKNANGTYSPQSD